MEKVLGRLYHTDGRVKKDVVRSKKGQTASSGSREMQELTSTSRDEESLPWGTAVTESPEWRGGGPLHGTDFVRGSKGRRRGWNRYERCPRGRPMDQAGDAAVCAGDERGCRGFKPGACPGDCQRPSVHVALDPSSAASRRLVCIPFHPL